MSGTSNTGDAASGVFASSDSASDPATNEDRVRIDVRDSTIMTEAARAKGIVGAHTHTGGIDIDVSNTNITRRLMPTNLRLIPIVVLILVTLGVDKVQAAPVCSNTPAPGDRVYCEEPHASTDNIDIDLNGVTTDTTVDREYGAAAVHYGTGDITIDVEDSSFTTQGELAEGVHGWQAGTGNIDIDVRNIASHTYGVEANGVYGWKTVGDGNINVDVTGSMITTEGSALAFRCTCS